MRNGNFICFFLPFFHSFVLILPMRNGNTEEPKKEWNYGKVLILPMRNGNIDKVLELEIRILFLSYLWGMETKNSWRIRGASPPPSFLSYLWGMETKKWLLKTPSKCSQVLILPMRNGNLLRNLKMIYNLLVLILPMRNGNFISFALATLSWICSYPTYEEWKPYIFSVSPSILNKSSYPTYEEWKPSLNFHISEQIIMFLSYLWGMETNIWLI